MRWIVPAIACLQQHFKSLIETPAVYRPARCPTCGVNRLWAHGHYDRKADREGRRLNPVPVPRFLCTGCGGTCSSLPSCLAPRRWFDWAMQQAVLMLMVAGSSVRSCALRTGRDRRTVRRWCRWLQERHAEFAFFLCNPWPEWGRAYGWRAFWHLGFSQASLGELMAWLQRHRVLVP